MTFILKGRFGPISPGSALLFYWRQSGIALVSHDALHRVSKSALIREKSTSHEAKPTDVVNPSFILKVSTPYPAFTK